MARTLSVRPMSLPAATLSTPPAPSRGSTTALRGSQGPSGIPEVPSSGLPSPPSSPPLAAITATNELALTPKKRSSAGRGLGGSSNGSRPSSNRAGARGGATLRIREECERFFCETLQAVFYGEWSTAKHGSVWTGVYNNNDDNYGNGSGNRNGNGQLGTPPDEEPPIVDGSRFGLGGAGGGHGPASMSGWLEIWDYAGGASFRAFLAEDGDGDKTLFTFFDAGVIGRDLKQALVALIELAEGPLGCTQLVVCMDRMIGNDDAGALVKGLQWAGFSLSTLDYWSGGLDVTSKRWVFMGLEL